MNNKRLTILNVLMCIMASIAILMGIFHASSVLPTVDNLASYSNQELTQWDLDSKDDKNSIYTMELSAKEISGRYILLWNEGQSLTLSVNGQTLCIIDPDSFTPTLRVSGMTLIALPECIDNATLQLSIQNGKDGSATVPTIMLGTEAELIKFLLRRDASTVIMLVLLITLTLIVILSGVLFGSYFNHGIQLAGLILFLISGCLWAITDSSLYLFLGIPMEMAGIICYYAFMLLPVPVLMQCWSIDNKAKGYIRFFLLLPAINIVVQTILSTMGIIPLQSMIGVTHILMFTTIAVCMLSIRAYLNKTDNPYLRLYYYDFIVLTIFAILAVVLYWFFGGKIYRILTLTGMFLFHLIVEWIILIEHRHDIQIQNEKEAQSRVLQAMSYTDTMTSLPNRRSFDEHLNKIEKDSASYPNALLMMLDLNGLKIVNDTYGHNAGDDLICKAGQCLQDCFGDIGLVCRIGGDEFTVVIDDAIHSPFWYMDILRSKANQLNSTFIYNLSFAIGCSYYFDEKGEAKSLSNWKQEADNAMYADKGRRKREEKGDLGNLKDVIYGIARAADAKDVNTSEHSLRVAAMSVFLAKEAGLPQAKIDDIESAARLHNLGNIAIPDRILMKPGKLTPEERKAMQRHSSIGSSMVEQAVGLESISRMILQHHERWDGCGYPDGLKEEQIDIGARIIAICDSIEAMTSPRPFRNALSFDECYKEIQENLGGHYDPKLGQLALDHWDEIIDLRTRKIKLL